MAVHVRPSSDGRTFLAGRPQALFTTRLARGINIAGARPVAWPLTACSWMNIRLEEQSPIASVRTGPPCWND